MLKDVFQKLLFKLWRNRPSGKGAGHEAERKKKKRKKKKLLWACATPLSVILRAGRSAHIGCESAPVIATEPKIEHSPFAIFAWTEFVEAVDFQSLFRSHALRRLSAASASPSL